MQVDADAGPEVVHEKALPLGAFMKNALPGAHDRHTNGRAPHVCPAISLVSGGGHQMAAIRRQLSTVSP
jgi:hypothetical protein